MSNCTIEKNYVTSLGVKTQIWNAIDMDYLRIGYKTNVESK